MRNKSYAPSFLISAKIPEELHDELAKYAAIKGVTVEENAAVSYVIADKNVTVRRGGTLSGHENYPMAISKNSTI